MFRLEMLPARCGDCLLLEYGPPGASRLVVIDGGLGETAAVLWNRLEGLRHERGAETLEIELLVVTHIDNDHIVGIIELLKAAHPTLMIHDIWFNGRPQLMGLPAASSSGLLAACCRQVFQSGASSTVVASVPRSASSEARSAACSAAVGL